MSETALKTPNALRPDHLARIHRLLTSPAAIRVAVLVMLVVVWELAARLWGNPMFVAPASSTMEAASSLLTQPDLLLALVMVLAACLVAFALSIIVGAALGLLIGLNAFVRDAFFPILLLFYATPQTPFLPLVTLLFGTGLESRIVFGFTHGIFPMAVTVIAGLQQVDKRLLVAARSMGANPLQLLSRVIMPFILQSLFTGMRLTMSVVLLGVLVSELYISTGGIGFFAKMFSNRFEPANLFALIAMLALIAITLNESCRTVQRAYGAWRETA